MQKDENIEEASLARMVEIKTLVEEEIFSGSRFDLNGQPMNFFCNAVFFILKSPTNHPRKNPLPHPQGIRDKLRPASSFSTRFVSSIAGRVACCTFIVTSLGLFYASITGKGARAK